MRWRGVVSVLALGGCIACSGNSRVESGPSPRAEVLASGNGTVVTDGSSSTAATLGIPPGHLPAPGACRVWEPGRPPGRQRHLPSGSCRDVERQVRPGQWLVYRPGDDRKVVEVRTYEAARSGGIVLRLTRVFDIATGKLLREIEG